MTATRQCRTCGEVKPVDEFYTNGRAGYRQLDCKQCSNRRRVANLGKDVRRGPRANRPTPAFGDPRLPERFWSRVLTPDPATSCWEWAGYRDRKGYGRFSLDGRRQLAHRVAFTALAGPIPDGQEIDHVCGRRDCVNPSHLRPASRAENKRAGHVAGCGPSGFIGVSWRESKSCKGKGRWRATGALPSLDGRKGKQVHLGYFNSEIEAAQAYDAFARAHYGEFARTNVDRGLYPVPRTA